MSLIRVVMYASVVTKKLPDVKKFALDKFHLVEVGRWIQFLKFFEQFGEALPQFILGLIFYVNNDYYINTYDKGKIIETDLSVTLVSVIFSGVSVLLGLITGLVTIKKMYDDEKFDE